MPQQSGDQRLAAPPVLSHGVRARQQMEPRVGDSRVAGGDHDQESPRLEDPSQLAASVLEVAKSGDMVVCLGAGSISGWAYALPGELQALAGKPSPTRGAPR